MWVEDEDRYHDVGRSVRFEQRPVVFEAEVATEPVQCDRMTAQVTTPLGLGISGMRVLLARRKLALRGLAW